MTPYDDTAARPSPSTKGALVDGFGRTVTYLRLSVTDRCDLRCVYCMAEHMTFLPKNLGNPYFDTSDAGGEKAVKEFGGKFDEVGPDTAGPDAQEITQPPAPRFDSEETAHEAGGGLNWYFDKHELKVQSDYLYLYGDDGGRHQIRVQAQLYL